MINDQKILIKRPESGCLAYKEYVRPVSAATPPPLILALSS